MDNYNLGDDPSDNAAVEALAIGFKGGDATTRKALKAIHEKSIAQAWKNISRLERELRAAQRVVALRAACLNAYDEIERAEQDVSA